MSAPRSVALVVALLSFFTTAVGAQQRGEPAASPAAAVTALYTCHLAHDMAFTLPGVSQRSAWLAPDLLALCRAYFARPASPDEVAEIDGDPFTDSQEYPTRFRLGQVQRAGASALVPVILSWPGGEIRTVRVHVARIRNAWLVTDVMYESGESFRKLLAGRQEGALRR